MNKICIIKPVEYRKAKMRLSEAVMLKRDDPMRHDKSSVSVLSDQELMDWKAEITNAVKTEIASQLKHWGFTDEGQLTYKQIRHLDGMMEQISDITLVLAYHEQKKQNQNRKRVKK